MLELFDLTGSAMIALLWLMQAKEFITVCIRTGVYLHTLTHFLLHTPQPPLSALVS